jgi:hypothetical protein
MSSVLIMLVLVLVLATVLTGVLRSVIRTWLDYRLRLALLNKLEHTSLTGRSPEEVERVLQTAIPGIDPTPKQDYAITGTILAFIGLGLFLTGNALRVGSLAMGTYYGGAACILLGGLLLSAGLVVRFLKRATKAH